MTAANFFLRAALALFFILPAIARAQPAALTLRFDFLYNGIKAADVVEIFTPQNGEYTIASHAKATGLAKLLYGDVIRKSAGRLDAKTGLFPLRYEEKRGRRPRTWFMLDEQAGVLYLHEGEEKRSIKFPDEVLRGSDVLTDYLSALYRPYVLGKPAAGKAAATNGWRLNIYEYKAGEPEKIQTPLGEILAVPVRRESPRGERIFWLAKKLNELNYIPVKVFINDKGHRFETVITEINGGGAVN